MTTGALTMINLAHALAPTQQAQTMGPQNFDGEINSINRDYGLADALAQQQYIPNSGWLGALAQAASGLSSHYVGKRADKKSAEVGAKVEAQRQAQEAARAEAEAQKQAEQYAREDARFQAQEAARMARIQAQEDARNKRHAEKLAADLAKGSGGGGGGAKAPASPYGNQVQALVDAGIVSAEEAAKVARQKAGLDKPAPEPRAIPAEQAGRIALTDVYLRDAPQIAEQIKAGTLTGPLDQSMANMGVGKPGEALRKMKSGADALRRGLSGAGMPAAEADDYVSRYLPAPFDTAETLLSKHAQLTQELQRFRQVINQGQNGR
jgi:hypothetical protein